MKTNRFFLRIFIGIFDSFEIKIVFKGEQVFLRIYLKERNTTFALVQSM